MSEPDNGSSKRGRRAAVVVVTGLVAGAALGTVSTEHGTSIRDRIAASFTPGARPAESGVGPIVIVNND